MCSLGCWPGMLTNISKQRGEQADGFTLMQHGVPSQPFCHWVNCERACIATFGLACDKYTNPARTVLISVCVCSAQWGSLEAYLLRASLR